MTLFSDSWSAVVGGLFSGLEVLRVGVVLEVVVVVLLFWVLLLLLLLFGFAVVTLVVLLGFAFCFSRTIVFFVTNLITLQRTSKCWFNFSSSILARLIFRCSSSGSSYIVKNDELLKFFV